MQNKFTIYRDAVIIPPTKIDENRYNGRAGVFDCAGKFIPESATRSIGKDRHAPAKMPDKEQIQYLAGTHSFGGVFFGHFGHFITESMGRLWTLSESDLSFESVVYIPKDRPAPPRAAREKEKLLNALGINAKIRVVSEPIRVEKLIVPVAKFGLDDALIDATPRYVSFIKSCASNQVSPKGGELLYVSRQGLPIDRGTMLGESLIEKLLSEEGYTIWRPQEHSIDDQIAQYRAAKKIISVDASPLHLLAYVANDNQKISIIKRRSMDAYIAIIRHINAFSSPEINIIDELTADYIRPNGGRIGRSSWGEVSIQNVGARLAEQGMISKPEKWRNLSDNEISSQINFIQERAEGKYTRIQRA